MSPFCFLYSVTFKSVLKHSVQRVCHLNYSFFADVPTVSDTKMVLQAEDVHISPSSSNDLIDVIMVSFEYWQGHITFLSFW